MYIQKSDLEKIIDALELNKEYHEKRDEMNARIHKGDVRYSEITTTTQSAAERSKSILESHEKRKQLTT